MTVTYGFYNSLNGDRKYDAVDVSQLFDGIINDGVYASIGTAMAVTASDGLIVNVGVGRAWFNHTWTLNDAILPLTLPDAELLYGRIDAIILEVDASDAVRANAIKVLKGTPSSTPQRPTLTNTTTLHQYAIAYINVAANVTQINQADITSMVGTSSFPFVTGIIRTISIDSMVAQWGDQWNQWFQNEILDADGDLSTWLQERKSEIEGWQNTQYAAFEEWWESLETSLSGDVAASLAQSIAALERRMNTMEECCGTLQSEQRIYQTLQDSDGNDVLDSSNLNITTKVVFVQA